ncbi:hypothetical protein CoNPh35_CDS0041 [Staphylococcus phage S-CoN_Ph35]|nr:hypothetical protein CoNPh35_CDS0041 [Staphylococcus phage S-CoN_Ph35]
MERLVNPLHLMEKVGVSLVVTGLIEIYQKI